MTNVSPFFKLFKNKFVFATVAFLFWLAFLDRYDILFQYKCYREVQKLRKERDFYIREIARVRKDIEDLEDNTSKLEQLAREKYLMKRDNEDIYLIVQEDKQ